jgi:hypothetical protein
MCSFLFERMRHLALFLIVLLQQSLGSTGSLFEERLNLTFRIKAVFSGNGVRKINVQFGEYKKRVVVQNKENLLLKSFCKTFKHYNSFFKF